MATIVTLLPDGYIHVFNNDPPKYEVSLKHNRLTMQGKGRFDPVTKTVFLEYRKQLIPVPLLGDINVQDFQKEASN